MPMRARAIAASIILFLAFFAATARATPDTAERTGQPCVACHLDESGIALNDAGRAFKAGGMAWPPTAAGPLLPLGGAVHAVLGFIHIVAGFLWFGTILYVHIILRPQYAEKGIPPAEVRLGGVSMAVAGISGLILTLARINGLGAFTAGWWGMLLGLKIILYLAMVTSAALVVNVIGPKLKEGLRNAEHPPDGVFAPEALAAFDGKDGRPAFVAYRGKVFDASNRLHWKDGAHFKHQAGMDLTAALAKAPHGAEKLDGLPLMGSYDERLKPSLTPPQKAFHFIANMNLTLVFVVLLVIAFWRWWA